MTSHAVRKTLALTLALAATLTFVPGCRKKPVQISPEIAASDEALYKLGEAEMKKDSEKALLYLRQVIDSFPKSFYAQRAKLLIADTYFKKGDEGNLILAAAEYREFIKSYPFSPSSSYCQYQIAMTFYKKVLKPGRDQAKTIQALAEFKKLVTDYPASDQAKETQDKIKDCEERLAEHETGIGTQYAKMRVYRAAINRLSEVMTTYPNYSQMDVVYFYLGESYFLAKALDQAVPYFTKLVSDYPKSKLIKKATARLKQIEAAKKPIPPKVK
ncbi:MAG: outer membrane protein assembly factor BamD [Candidatus Aminicenantales bacterium]|jgi:outer membrane protein assembly factor BamD